MKEKLKKRLRSYYIWGVSSLAGFILTLVGSYPLYPSLDAFGFIFLAGIALVFLSQFITLSSRILAIEEKLIELSEDY